MFKVLRPDADAYLTNRVVNGTPQLSANTGAAGSLDLFKLYGYTTIASSSYSSGSISGSSWIPSGAVTAYTLPNVELSRLLIHFDLTPLRELVAAGDIDPTNATFHCKLHLFDVYGGQPTPSNFTVDVFPLSASFTEGLGRDVVYYSDSDVCNWLTSSYASGSWFASGCGMSGSAQQLCDYVTGSSLIAGGTSLEATQFFPKGTEDLCVDVTTIVSATLAGLLPDAGFRISYDASLENDVHTYFVKRFGSRTAYNTAKHPRLEVTFDDSIQDDTGDFYLDSPSYLFFYNYVRSSLANLASGSLRTPVTGSNCLKLYFVADFPGILLGEVSSSVVVAPTGHFAFYSGSYLTFVGNWVGDVVGSGSTSTTGSLLVTQFLSGNFTAQAVNVLSGTFTLADGVTPVLYGTALFTGTLAGVPDTYQLTGTYLPSGAYLFSGTYASSGTLGPIDYVIGPFSASQYYSGINPQVGIYSSSVLLSSTDPNLQPQWQFSGSITLTPIWGSLDGTVAYLTGSAVKAFPPQRGPQSLAPRKLSISVYNLSEKHAADEIVTLRVYIFDYTQPELLEAVRLPVELPGIVIRDVFYQIRDVETSEIPIPFDTVYNSTRLSNDSATMFFNLDMSNLTLGHTYVVDVLVSTIGSKQLYRNASAPFSVVAPA